MEVYIITTFIEMLGATEPQPVKLHPHCPQQYSLSLKALEVSLLLHTEASKLASCVDLTARNQYGLQKYDLELSKNSRWLAHTSSALLWLECNYYSS